MKVLLVILAVLITYGSLYPFDFGAPQADAIKRITSTLFDPFATEPSDILGNVALFVPFGFAGVLAFSRFRPVVSLVGLVFPLGTLFALILQIAQIFVPQRDPSLIDVFWNAIGLALGGGLAVLAPFARRLQLSLSDPARFEVPVALAACWIASQLVPFVPSIDLQSVKDGVKALVLLPNLDLGEAGFQTAAWLVALHLLSAANLPAGFKRLLPTVPLVALAAQPFIIRNGLTPDEVVGGVGALVIWSFAGRMLRPSVLAAMLGAVFAAVNLAGLNFDTPGQVFSWIPFNDFLQGSMVFNAAVLLEKLFVYGALIWLMKEAGLEWTRATAITVVALSGIEVLEIDVPDSTAGVTDPVLAVLIAAAMSAMASARQAALASHSLATASPTRHALPRNGVALLTKTGASNHLGSLDGLRGFAALSVFAVHFQQAAHVQATIGPFDLDRFLANGNSGVALFFILSGFLLSIPFWLAQDKKATPVDIKSYVWRRLARILPAYYLLLFLLLSASNAMGNLPSINNILSHVLFLHNLKDDSILSINPPFWTLAVEMQFYVLLPLLFLALAKLSSPMAFVTVLALSVLSYFVNYEVMTALLRLNHWPIFIRLVWPFALDLEGPQSFVLTYSTLAHLTFFFMGMSAAWLFVRRPPEQSPRFVNLVAMDLLFWISAIAALVILSTPLDDALQFPFGHYNWPYVPLLFAVMVFTGPRAMLAKAALGWSPIRWLGLISYGVYIFHYPVLRVVEIVMTSLNLDVHRFWFVFGGAALPATLVVASISYLVMEKPIMGAVRRKWPVQRQAASPPQPVASTRELPSGWQKVPLGLRSEHVEYLNDVASENGRTLSGATRHVIAEFIRQLSTEDAGTETQAPRNARGLELSSMLAARVERVGEEQEHLVNLSEDQREFLGALSERLGMTVSRTVQIIVDQFISEKSSQPKSSATKGAYG